MTQPTAQGNRTRAAILDAIRSYIAAHGYPPTIREIAEAVGLASTSTVSAQLDQLEKRGRIERDRKVARGLRIVEQKDDSTIAHGTVKVLDAESEEIELEMVPNLSPGEYEWTLTERTE